MIVRIKDFFDVDVSLYERLKGASSLAEVNRIGSVLKEVCNHKFRDYEPSVSKDCSMMIDKVMYQRRMAILDAIPPWSPKPGESVFADDPQRRLRQYKYMELQDRAHQQLRIAAMQVLEQFKDQAIETENSTQYETKIVIDIDKQQPKAAAAGAMEASKKNPIDDTQYSLVRMDATKVQMTSEIAPGETHDLPSKHLMVDEAEIKPDDVGERTDLPHDHMSVDDNETGDLMILHGPGLDSPVQDTPRRTTRSQARRSTLAPTDSSAGRSSVTEELSTTTPGRRVHRRTSTATA
jgi:hypothetical protein